MVFLEPVATATVAKEYLLHIVTENHVWKLELEVEGLFDYL